MYIFLNGHRYSLASTGLVKNVDREFNSREQATETMYKICKKYGLCIEEIYDDKHDKTYICNQGVRFYIHRM